MDEDDNESEEEEEEDDEGAYEYPDGYDEYMEGEDLDLDIEPAP